MSFASGFTTKKDLYNLLGQVSEMPEDVLLRVGNIGCDGNLSLDFVLDGESVGPCPLVEIAPGGQLGEQVAVGRNACGDRVEIGPIEGLRAELDCLAEKALDNPPKSP
jgi:hypothetical protein